LGGAGVSDLRLLASSGLLGSYFVLNGVAVDGLAQNEHKV
jgi:hypothetical protein